MRYRIIPVLLLHNGGLVKTVNFKNPKYVGDPVNAVRIFNEKEVDELILLDISATRERRAPDLAFIQSIVSEAFMPVCYGGGIHDIETVQQLLELGIEKVAINTEAVANPELLTEVSALVGSQSIVASLDYRRGLFGKKEVWTAGGSSRTGSDLLTLAKKMEARGAGELMLTSIERDGTFSGYDLEVLKKVSETVRIPVIASGGAGAISDFDKAVAAGASAVSAGSLFVFHGPHRAVLISYPSDLNRF